MKVYKLEEEPDAPVCREDSLEVSSHEFKVRPAVFLEPHLVLKAGVREVEEQSEPALGFARGGQWRKGQERDAGTLGRDRG